jgi:DNA-binding transcriptional ArsR family regulator
VPRPDARKRLKQLNAVFTALNHPARRQILMTIHFRGGEMTAGEIAARFRHSWPTTTRHLGVLETAHLIQGKQEGRIRRYRVNVRHLKVITEWLKWFDKPVRDREVES